MNENIQLPPSWSVAPVFLVSDVVATARYYRDKLGFSYDQLWGDPPSFCMVRRSGVILMLNQLPTRGGTRPNRLADPANDAWDAYVWVSDADALHDELASKGVRITRGLCTQHYGCRDFDVEDCNGYRICFGQAV